MTIANLFARLGFEADTGKIKNFKGQLSNVVTGLNQAVELALKFTNVMKSFTQETFRASIGLKQFEAETGASAEELQRWQAVAERTNNSAEAVTQSVKSIVANQQKIKLGQGGNISGYQLLGIDPTQDPFEILTQLRSSMAGLDQGMKKHALSMMGVSSEMLQVLDLTNDEFDRMSKSAFVIPQGQIEIMNKTNSVLMQTRQGVKWLKAQIAVELAPSIIKLNREISKWIRNNKEGIVKTVKKVFVWVTKFTTSIMNAARMLDRIVKNTVGWENAIKGIIAVLAILNAGLLASPIGIFIAGIILLIAVLDDLYIYSLKGEGKSLFGLLMKQFPELEKSMGKFFKNIKKGFQDIKDTFENLFGVVEALIKLMSGDFTFKEAVDFMGEKGKKTGSKIKENVQKYKMPIKEGEFWDWGSIKKRLFDRSHITNYNDTKIDVKVDTKATDPKDVAKEVDKTLKDSIEKASKQIPRNE